MYKEIPKTGSMTKDAPRGSRVLSHAELQVSHNEATRRQANSGISSQVSAPVAAATRERECDFQRW